MLTRFVIESVAGTFWVGGHSNLWSIDPRDALHFEECGEAEAYAARIRAMKIPCCARRSPSVSVYGELDARDGRESMFWLWMLIDPASAQHYQIGFERITKAAGQT